MVETIWKHRTLLSRFIVVGSIGFICNYVVLKLLTLNHINSVLAEVIAVAVALHVTFVLHDNWTYKFGKEKSHHHALRVRHASYITSNLFGSLMTVILFSAFYLFLTRFEALVIASLIAMFWNFFMNKKVIWRQRTA